MRVACIGNAVYDITVNSEKNIMEGVRNSFSDATFTIGGPASNAASVIARFGTDVSFYGRIGNDLNGRYVYEKMLNENIDISHLVVSNELMTPFSLVAINPLKNTRTIFTVRSKEDYHNPKIGITNFADDYDYILTDGKYVDDTFKLMEQNPNAKTVIDAGRVNDGILKLCQKMDYIICSEDFANEVTKSEINDNYANNVNIFNKMKELFPKALGITITIGKDGYICEKDNQVVINPAYKSSLKVVDTNAAGDIFHGAFTYAMANNYDYHDALEFANTTASLSVTKAGGRDSCPNLEEALNALNKEKGKVKKLSF